MPRVIVLDTFPLSAAAKPDARPGAVLTTSDQCRLWVEDCIQARNRIVVPGVCYYELLRELERLNATAQIARLRNFCHTVPDRYLPIKDTDLDLAAKLWAQARNTGRPTSSAASLDADMILCAQVLNLGLPLSEFVVATTNPGHLSLFVPCDLWTNIAP